MTHRLRSLLRIHPGEERVAFRLLVFMLVGMTGAAIGANGVEGLFFSRFGPDFLPYLYVFLGPLTFAVMIGMSTLLSREAKGFLVALPLGLAVTLVAARAVLLMGLNWFYPLLWLVMMVLWTSQVMGSWGLAGAVSDTRQAKRLFPLYGAGLIAGGVIGGLATGPLAALLGTENLLLVWTGALVVMFLLARSVVGVPAASARKRRPRRVGVARQLSDGFRDVWTWPLLRWMSISLVLFAILYFTLALLFAESATARFPRTEDLAGFLGLFMGLSNGVALLVSLFVANRLFARFGVPAMVLVLAVIYLAGYGIVAFATSFASLVAFRFIQMVWVNGVWATGWQALFNVVPEERRARTRMFMDGGPLQTGIVLSGVLLILADLILGQRQLFIVGAIAAAAAVWSMWRARRAYGGALEDALRTGNPDVFRPEDEPFGGFCDDADAFSAVVAGTSSPDPVVRRVSMQILADLGTQRSAPALIAGLSDEDPHVRSASIRGLARAGIGASDLDDFLSPLEALLEDPNPEVRAGAASALMDGSDDRARRTLLEMSRDDRPAWRAAAIGPLGRAGDHRAEVVASLTDPDPAVRRAAASALAGMEPERSVEPLIEALGDGDRGVRDAAASALARAGPPAEPPLTEALARPELEEGALLALVTMDGADPDPLHAYARDQVRLAQRYQDLWLAAGSDPDDRVGLLAHGLRHRTLRHAVHALRASGRSGHRDAVEMAIDNLSSRDPQQRANALEMLEATGEAEVVRPLVPMWEARPIRPPNGPAAVAEVLHDPDPWLRACAALAAGAFDGPGLAGQLEELARSDADPVAREAATTSLRGGPVETLSTLSLLDRVLFLRKVPLFADLSPEDLKHVAEVVTEHVYPDGEIIAEQGEAGDELHIVVEGHIRVLVGGDGELGREVARRARGENVGEMAIIGHEPRMASLVCAGSVRTLTLDRRSFERILRERPDVSLAVMRVLSDRLRAAYNDDTSEQA